MDNCNGHASYSTNKTECLGSTLAGFTLQFMHQGYKIWNDELSLKYVRLTSTIIIHDVGV